MSIGGVASGGRLRVLGLIDGGQSPKTSGTRRTSSGSAAGEHENGSKKRILIVDDDYDLVRVLKLYFNLSGFDVVSAANGYCALREIDIEPPDAVILDILMPGLDGLALCRRLRNGNGQASVPIVVFTGLTGSNWRNDTMDAGADEFITKPCNFAVLRDSVCRLIAEREW